MGQTPGKTSHSFTSGQRQASRRGKGWRLPGAVPLGPQDTTWSLGRGKGQCQPQGLADRGEDPGTKEGECLDLKWLQGGAPGSPHDTRPRVAWRANRRGWGWGLPSQLSPFTRAKPRAQAGSVVGERSHSLHSNTGDLSHPSCPDGVGAPEPPPRALPMSQRSQGLPQAAPSAAQHSDRRVAPCRFASQRPSWTFSQQVPLVLSAGRGLLSHPAGPHLHADPQRPSLLRGVGVPAAPWGLSPKHTVPEGPRRLPGAHSQA